MKIKHFAVTEILSTNEYRYVAINVFKAITREVFFRIGDDMWICIKCEDILRSDDAGRRHGHDADRGANFYHSIRAFYKFRYEFSLLSFVGAIVERSPHFAAIIHVIDEYVKPTYLAQMPLSAIGYS